jgi:hypothetical protein
MILPPSSCEQTWLLMTHLSLRTSSSVARLLGSSSSILPIMCRLSRGSRRRSRQGPLITAGFSFSPSVLDNSSVGVPVPSFRWEWPDGCRDAGSEWVPPVTDLGPSFGGATKSLYELSVRRGAFQGNRRSVMQQKMMASDQISAGWGSYLERS